MIKHWYRLTGPEARKLIKGLRHIVNVYFDTKRGGIRQSVLREFIRSECSCGTAIANRLAFEYLIMVRAEPFRKRFKISSKRFAVYYLTYKHKDNLRLQDPDISWKVYDLEREWTRGRPLKVYKKKGRTKDVEWKNEAEHEDYLEWKKELTKLQKTEFTYEWNRKVLSRKYLVQCFRNDETPEEVFEKWLTEILKQ